MRNRGGNQRSGGRGSAMRKNACLPPRCSLGGTSRLERPKKALSIRGTRTLTWRVCALLKADLEFIKTRQALSDRREHPCWERSKRLSGSLNESLELFIREGMFKEEHHEKGRRTFLE